MIKGIKIIFFVLTSVLIHSCLSPTNKEITDNLHSEAVRISEINEECSETQLQDIFFIKNFSGAIDGRYDITMMLCKSKNKLQGNYYYNKYRGLLILEGSIDDRNNFEVREMKCTNGEITGYFKGKFISECQAVGVWENIDGTKSFPFEIYQTGLNRSKFQIFQKSEEYRLTDDPESPVFDISISYLHPLYIDNSFCENSPQGIKSFQNFCGLAFFGEEFTGKPEKDIAKMYTENVEEYTYTNEDTYDPEMMFSYNWSFYKHLSILYMDDRVVTLSQSEYLYTGGAHGLEHQEYLHFDFNTGKQFTLNDIIKTGSEDKITNLIGRYLMKSLEIQTKEELEGILINELYASSSFFFTSNELVFVYNPYEIAPYVYGIIYVFVPFSEMKSYLKEDSPMSHLYEMRKVV